jgi:plasmid replication initiation protein
MTLRTAPKGHNQTDLFAAGFADVPIRDQRDTMERPFFSLAKKPRHSPIEYHVGQVYVKVSPNKEHGIATIWDADILIWAATQITEALDRGLRPGPVLTFHPYALLKSIRRDTSGRSYQRLKDAFNRLASTYVQTNIRSSKGDSFHWLEGWGYEDDQHGNPISMYLTLPQWLYKGIVQDGGVLTIHEDYFLLTGGIERWLYRVARKHAGSQDTGWQFTMRQLYDKSGSCSRFSDFALDVRRIIDANTLPEYALSISTNAEGDHVVSMVRRSRLAGDQPDFEIPRLRRRRMAGGITKKAFKFNG